MRKSRTICRVHWLLWNLTPFFKGSYKLYYNYATHKYLFYRMVGINLFDIFSVKIVEYMLFFGNYNTLQMLFLPLISTFDRKKNKIFYR